MQQYNALLIKIWYCCTCYNFSSVRCNACNPMMLRFFKNSPTVGDILAFVNKIQQLKEYFWLLKFVGWDSCKERLYFWTYNNLQDGRTPVIFCLSEKRTIIHGATRGELYIEKKAPVSLYCAFYLKLLVAVGAFTVILAIPHRPLLDIQGAAINYILGF